MIHLYPSRLTASQHTPTLACPCGPEADPDYSAAEHHRLPAENGTLNP